MREQVGDVGVEGSAQRNPGGVVLDIQEQMGNLVEHQKVPQFGHSRRPPRAEHPDPACPEAMLRLPVLHEVVDDRVQVLLGRPLFRASSARR